MAFLRNTFYLLLGLLALPLVILLNFRTMKTFAKSLFSGLTDVSLADTEYRDRITYDTVTATASMQCLEAVKDQCRALVNAGDWQALATQLAAWDQDRSKCDAQYSLAQTGVQAVLYHLADRVVEGHSCHPDPIAIIPDDVVEDLECLVTAYPEHYPLIALAAQARCYQGWVSRGPDYARYVSDDGWFGMGQHFAKAEGLLDRYDPVALNSPLLAAARHRLLGFMPDADKRVAQFYEDWSALDPLDQGPHAKHAIMMLPRWFGSEQAIEVEARKAAARTGPVTGDAAYFTIYQRVLNTWDPAVLTMDTEFLRRGAHDLVSLRNDDPAFVAGLFQEMCWWTAIGSDNCYTENQRALWSELAADIDDIRRDLLLTRLTAVCPSAWKNGADDALGYLSTYLQDEIRAGATFRIGTSGLKVLLPDAPQMPHPA